MKLFINFRREENFWFLDKFKDKPFTFFYDYLPKNRDELNINPYNFIMVHEPDEFFGYHRWIKENHHLYNAILTWNEDIAKTCDNTSIFTCNYQQDNKEFYDKFLNVNKKFEVSFLCGIKNISAGHKYRHEIYDLVNDINIPKKWFKVLDDFDLKNNVRPGYNEYDKNLNHIPKHLLSCPQVFGKRICYEESMFHVCVENIKSNNWYTEKIGESFCTKTVPIYWGCPNIGDFYDKRGIITFETKEELINIINNLTPEMYYDMKKYIDYNYNLALQDSFEKQLCSFFDEIIVLNNI